MMPESWIQIAVIHAVNPFRREIRVRAEPGCARQFEDLAWVRVVLQDGTALRCKVASVETGEAGIRIGLTPGVPRDTVARMKGAAVVVAKDVRRPPAADDYDVTELQGLAVHERDGGRLGRIVDAYWTAAHGVVEIEKPGGTVILLPVVKEVIVHVDFDRGIVTVNDVAPFAVEDETATPHGERDED